MNVDAIVVGLGAVGSATLWQLARRGATVLGIDRYAPPHDMGSSHGRSRITRVAVGEGAAYVPLVRRSHALWREIESLTGDSLMHTTGVLVLGRAGVPGSFVDSTLAVAQQCGIAHEALDAAELRHRYPQFQLRGDEHGCFEPGGGALAPERCVAAQLALATRSGAALRLNEPVLRMEPDGDGMAVHTAQGRYRAAQVVLATGAWIPGMAGDGAAGWADALRVMRQTLHWFKPHDAAAFAPGRFPTFIWTDSDSHFGSIYGFPMLDGVAGVKVASSQYERSTTPDAVERSVSPDESAALFEQLVQPRLPGLSATCVQQAACLYTVAPDSRFLIGAHPRWPRVQVASACSGHGFKHSAGLGEALAERVLNGRSAIDLSPFTPTQA